MDKNEKKYLNITRAINEDRLIVSRDKIIVPIEFIKKDIINEYGILDLVKRRIVYMSQKETFPGINSEKYNYNGIPGLGKSIRLSLTENNYSNILEKYDVKIGNESDVYTGVFLPIHDKYTMYDLGLNFLETYENLKRTSIHPLQEAIEYVFERIKFLRIYFFSYINNLEQYATDDEKADLIVEKLYYIKII